MNSSDKNPSYLNNVSGQFIEQLYEQYLKDPSKVDPKWVYFFEGYEFKKEYQEDEVVVNNDNFIEISDSEEPNKETNRKEYRTSPFIINKEVAVSKLINGYRRRGHLLAKINPLNETPNPPLSYNDLTLSYYRLSEQDLETEFEAAQEINLPKSKLKDIIAKLQSTYCKSIGAEFVHCKNGKVRWFIYDSLETYSNTYFDSEQKISLYSKLDHAVSFESFLNTKYVGKKRFGLEGLESFIPALSLLLTKGGELGVEEYSIGMAHRGRLNILVNIFKKSFENLIAEFEGGRLPKGTKGDGDVKYHLGQSADITLPSGKNIHLSLAFNPSHLEAINAVVSGMTRGKCRKYYQNNTNKIVPILIHGDAAIAGQGINYELANMSKVEGYDSGGSIHIVLNNQLGFTANDKETRSNVYCTDLAKVTDSPVFHVNANDVEAVAYTMEMAIKIRQEFNIDVWVDVIGYRRYGHNESDEPRFTQPVMYEKIAKIPVVIDFYREKLLSEGIFSSKVQLVNISKKYKDRLEEGFNNAKKKPAEISIETLKKHWQGIRVAQDKDFEKSIDTSFSKEKLDTIAKTLTSFPNNFNPLNKMKKLIETRKKKYFEEGTADWSLAEQLAYGSLLMEGFSIRITGQDSQRGTFSHRHAVIKDAKTEKHFTFLNELPTSNRAIKNIKIYNSVLSEYSVLGFEYGYSLSRPNALVIWEAQFGDFANGAQVIIDQFISSGESKWQRYSGLVLLLPHGYEGMGPEHSSARLERFLQMCAENNMYVVNITTPANFFHLLRRQLKNPYRKPLIVMSPKSLLRHAKVISDIKDLCKGRFLEIIEDKSIKTTSCKKVLFCSGKIYYELLDYQQSNAVKDVAIIRIEQLYPLVLSQLKAIKKKYSQTKKWYWVQEESENMGAWQHINDYLSSFKLKCISRPKTASPATGIIPHHIETQKELIEKAFKA